MSYPHDSVSAYHREKGNTVNRAILALVGVVLISLSVVIASASSAGAKVTSNEKRDYVIYVRELAPEAAPRFSDTVLLAMGKRVCKDYRRGLPEDSIAETIERMYLNHKVHFNFTARVLQASQLYFCPKFL